MRTEEYRKECPECHTQFIAIRTDQQFCNNKCRYDHHNRIARGNRKATKDYFLKIARNRDILLYLFGRKIIELSKKQLMDMGFNFQYHTHSTKMDELKVDFVCDYGLYPIEGGKFKIIQDEND